MIVTAELLAKLLAWKQAGNRCFKIESDQYHSDCTLWIYDLSLMAGYLFSGADECASGNWTDLIKRRKIVTLQAEMASIDQSKNGGDLNG